MRDGSSYSDPSRGAADQGLLGGVALILVVGVALGVGYNALGLQSKPARGLSWIGQDRLAQTPTLESLGAAGGDGAPGGSSYNQMSDPMGIRQAEGVPTIPDLDRPIQVTLEPVKQLFDAGAAVFVDAREPDEFAEGRIPGALSMPYDEVSSEPERLENIRAGGKSIVVYCGGGACELSINMAWDLIAAGQSKVLVYMGGFPEWAQAGYPVERGDGA